MPGIKTVEDSIFSSLEQLFKHLSTHSETYKGVHQFEMKAELGKKSQNLITQGSLRFKGD